MQPPERPDAPEPAPGSAAGRWDEGYRRGWTPWDIGRPQAAFARLADAGEIVAPVLDCGCGTGEQALMVAARGLEVLGVDISSTAIHRARRKAGERGLAVEFLVADALQIDRLGRQFATVIDSGTFHVFGDEDRARYVAALARAVKPGGVLHLMCFSELTPGEVGPRRVTQAELHEAFADGWRVELIRPERFEVKSDFPETPHAWLARIVRAE
jgi:ubiquinone/menaquinone biosynthesis C-methylase UbiE